jgi:hypothetical protein
MADEEWLIETLRKRCFESSREAIERLIEVNDVVCAVWPDAESSCGFSYLPLKGDAWLEALMANRQLDMKIAVVRCLSSEEASRFKDMFG